MRLIGDNTSEGIQLFPAYLTNFPLGAWALDGDDTVNGSGASDLILGNEGEDILIGFAGNDSVFGGKGRDALYGNEQNVASTYRFDGPQAILPLLPPDPAGAFRGSASGTQLRGGISGVYSGTLIRVRNSNAILGFVDGVKPNELESRIVSVQGF